MKKAHWKIVQACDEPIEKMDITARGHFCHACQKEVVNLDGKTAEEVGYKNFGDICGRITITPEVAVSPMGKWSSFMLRWLGVTALLFIPLKKGKTHVEKVAGHDSEEKKNVSKTKRIVGTVLDENNRPFRTKVTMSDTSGNIIAETISLANGRFMMQVDTPSIKTDTVLITAVDSPKVANLPVTFIANYPKDSIWLGPWDKPYQLGGVPMSFEIFNFKGPIVSSIDLSSIVVVIIPENAGDALEQEAQAGIKGVNNVSS